MAADLGEMQITSYLNGSMLDRSATAPQPVPSTTRRSLRCGSFFCQQAARALARRALASRSGQSCAMQTILRSQTASNVHSLNTLQRPPWASVNGSGMQDLGGADLVLRGLREQHVLDDLIFGSRVRQVVSHVVGARAGDGNRGELRLPAEALRGSASRGERTPRGGLRHAAEKNCRTAAREHRRKGLRPPGRNKEGGVAAGNCGRWGRFARVHKLGLRRFRGRRMSPR